MASGRSFTSKLLSFMGSQSSLPEKNSQDDIGSSQTTASEANSTPRQKHHRSRDGAQDKHRKALSPAAAIASSKDDSLPDMDSDGGEGEDFGTLQMFDSNASSRPYSSQAAPEAVMSSPKKKRDRKRSKNKNSDAPVSSTLNGSAADYDMPDAGEDANGATIASSPPKKKRRHSDSADSNGRKKRKSHKSSGEDGFLRRNKDRAATPEATGELATSQVSPSVAHGRRRSQSREGEEPGTGEISDVEALAREAWNEHLNTQRNAASQAESNAANPADSQPAAEEQPEETPGPRRGRSTRQKKAKPTYFEQPLVDDDDKENERRNAAGELPSPSAVSQGKRARKQPAAPKKTPKRQRQRKQKLANSMQGLDGEVAYRGSQKDFKQGKFSTEELDKIDDAIERFRLEHGYDKTHVNAMIQAPGGTGAGEDHAQLWLTILAECPDRHRQKVINVCRKKHHNFVARGTWTPEQDYELAEQINIHGTKWAVIGPIINRHPEDIRDRYRNYLVCGDTQRKEAWTEEEEALLTESVIQAMKEIDNARMAETANEVLQTKSYDELIDWQQISAQMGRTRSRLQCITKWKSMNLRNVSSKDKLASSQPDSQISFRLEMARRQIDDMPDEEKYRFVLAVQGSAVGVDNKIPWNKLMDKKFRQEYHKNTQVVLWSRLKHSVPGAETKTTRDCAQYLIEHYNQEGSLPDVTGEGFDDGEEMALVREVVKSEPASEGGFKGATGNERVEGDEAQDDDQQDQEMQIDPALTEVPKSSKKATPAAKRTLNGKKPSGRKPTRPAEPVEDDDELPELPNEDVEEEADEDGKKKKKKKKSSKKSSKKKVKAPSSDSVMDDMDDIPAR